MCVIENGKLKDLRIDNDYTQTQVATILGISQQHYQLYETNARKLQIDLLKKLCELYGVSADYILGLSKGLKWPR